jgi:hypothetical protein
MGAVHTDLDAGADDRSGGIDQPGTGQSNTFSVHCHCQKAEPLRLVRHCPLVEQSEVAVWASQAESRSGVLDDLQAVERGEPLARGGCEAARVDDDPDARASSGKRRLEASPTARSGARHADDDVDVGGTHRSLVVVTASSAVTAASSMRGSSDSNCVRRAMTAYCWGP